MVLSKISKIDLYIINKRCQVTLTVFIIFLFKMKVNPDVRNINVLYYHSGCSDGICGSWPIWRANLDRLRTYEDCQKLIDEDPSHYLSCNCQEMKIIPNYPEGKINKDDVKGKIVMLVDFCFKDDILLELMSEAKKVILLDHHLTTWRDITNIFELVERKSFYPPGNYPQLSYNITTLFHSEFEMIVDMDRSGAQLGWDYTYPKYEGNRPWFVDIIADRDMGWKWNFENSKALNTGLFVGKYIEWSKLEKLYKTSQKAIKSGKPDKTFDRLVKRGNRINTFREYDINFSATHTTNVEFEGHLVKLVECHPPLRTEIVRRIADTPELMGDAEIVASWKYNFFHRQWKLFLTRPKNSDLDVAQLIEKYNGGGHSDACGMTIYESESYEWMSADTKKRANMAHGHLHDYFKFVKKT